MVTLWAISAIYVYNSDWRSEASIALPLFMAVAFFAVLIVNAVMGSIAEHRNVMKALQEAEITHCSECGTGQQLHAIEFHYYAYIVVWFIQFTRRGKFCVTCARDIAKRSFLKTIFYCILCPPFIVWAWFEKRSILKRLA